ncbi:MAG: hypothetical protein HY707_01485 [Ignavibacteriae bacterium]|nr:hypothetical protein [Ignavibacteriota bacterium]
MNENNEIWDEFKWEEFMKEQDKKVDRYMELFYRYQDHPDRDEIIAREMGWTWLLEHESEDADASIFDDEEGEEGEEWKLAAGVSDESFEHDDFRNNPLYQKTYQFALRAVKFVDQLPEKKREDSSVVDFISNATIAGAKIAGGTGLGEDLDELGGNIAYCKRGLAAANLAIAALHEMKEKRIINDKTYFDLVKDATEVRDAIALHIVELREKFYRGV